MKLIIEKEYSLNTHNSVVNINNSICETITISELNDLLTILNLNKILTIKEYFNTFLNQLFITEYHIKYMSVKQKNDYILYLKKEIKNNIKYITKYIFNAFIERNLFFKKMKPVFMKEELLKVPKYLHSSKTGRAKIKDGFNFLTLKKSDRSNLRPLNKDHVLYEIDFVSCEPSFYLKSQGIDYKKDVYKHIANNLSIEIKNRDTFKRGILAILYGADQKTVTSISQLTKQNYIDINKFLNVSNFKKDLKEKFENNNFIQNFYGRPILYDNNLVNYWIQSSVADFCCLAFNQFLNKNNFLILNAFIHDAIIVSCPKKEENNLLSTKSIFEKRSNIDLEVKITKLHNN